MKSSSLNNISSVYTIRLIFSYLEYNHFFSLIKYNKQIQNKMKINLKENVFLNKYIERMTKKKYAEDFGERLALLPGAIIYGPIYIYFFLHYLLNAILTIDLNPKLYKNKDKYWEIINNSIIRKLLTPIFHFFSIYVIFHVLYNLLGDYISTQKIFLFLLDLVIIVHSLYEIALFKKIKMIYSYALNGKWIIFFDELLIIVNLIYIIVTCICYLSYRKIKTFPKYEKTYFLNQYKGILIKEFKISEDFTNYSQEDKNKFISTNVDNFKIKYSKNDLVLINHINDYRIKNNLNELIIDEKIPNFIIKGSTEIFLSSKNIMKLSNIKYVLRFNKTNISFETLQNNKEIMEIINNPFFNKINIVQQSENKYITIYEEFDGKNYDVISIRDNNGNENSILKTNVSD